MPRISSKQPLPIIVLVFVISLSLSSFFCAATPALAGKEGVYIAESSYYTLEEFRLSSGTDTQTARITLQVTNGSENVIDTNRFGAKIVDAAGAVYPAKLSEKAAARVWPNQTQVFKMVSSIPLGVSLNELSVMIFEWDKGASSFMREIGSLSAAHAAKIHAASASQSILNINEVDNGLPKDSLLSLELTGTYKVYKDGYWYLFMNVTAENAGSVSYKLPAALLYSVRNESGVEFEAGMLSGQELTLLPKEPRTLTLSAMVSSSFQTEGFSLNFRKKGQTESEILGSISLNNSEKVSKLNESSDIGGHLKATTSTLYSRGDSDGLHLQAVLEVSNEGEGIEALPELSAFYQFGTEGALVTSTDTSAHPAYLSSGQKTTYYFSAILPSGAEQGHVQFVLANKKAVNLQTAAGNGSSASTAEKEKTNLLLPLYLLDLTGQLSENGQAAPTGQNYTLGKPITFEAGTIISKTDLEISLVELNGLDNDDLGYKSVIGKFIFRNKGKGSLTMPVLGTELVSQDGYAYTGTRQAGAPSQLMPNTSYAVSYAFQLPVTDMNSDLVLRFTDDKTFAPNKVAISAHKVKLQEKTDDREMSLYPFKVSILDYSNYWIYNRSDSSYNVRLRLNLDIRKTEGIIVDQNFSKMQLEVVDGGGRTLSTQILNFAGAQKVTSGSHNLTFANLKSEQMDSNLVVKIYETIETPAGTAKRLLKVLELD